MAEKKVVGRLVNTVSFQTDRASLQKALADIKKVKDAMKGLVVPANAMRKQAAAMKQQVATKKQLVNQDKDWLVVQRAINKNKIKEEQREKRILDSKAKGLKLTERQTKANQRQQQIARKEAVARLTQGSGMKVNDMLFMRMSKQAEAYNKRRDAVLSRRDSQRIRRRINRSNSLESLHGQALGMNAAYDRRQARLHNRALADNAKRDRVASQNAARVSARRMDTVRSDRFGLTSRFGAGAGRGFDKIANQFSSGAISARMYRQQVSALRRDLSGAANAQRGFNGTLKDMRSAFVQATASYTAFAGISGAANIGKQYEARQAGMLVGTGDPEKARKQIAFLDKEIYRLGLDQQVASQGFVQMSVAAKGVLSEGDLQALFKGLGELSTAVQLDPFRFEKTILAISQVMNKTQLMSEEIKSQLTPTS